MAGPTGMVRTRSTAPGAAASKSGGAVVYQGSWLGRSSGSDPGLGVRVADDAMIEMAVRNLELPTQ